MTADVRHSVSTWEALMAIRYGMGRMTAANEDAAALARRVWPSLDEHTRNGLRADRQRLWTGSIERQAWDWLDEEAYR